MDTALILAGGASSRFGRTKAMEAVAGKPMVRWVYDALSGFAGEILVSVPEKSTARALEPVLPGARFILDLALDRGPIEGIHRGIEGARGDLVLIAPCDAPLLRPELYRLLLTSLGAREAAVPKRAVIDPIRAVYRTTAVRRALSSETDFPRSPSALVDRLDAAFVDEVRLRSVDPQLDSFLDVNEPADLDRVLARLRSA